MKFLNEEYLLEMSNIRGKYVQVEDIDFSFYFSSKNNVNSQHGIRVKICWNREKIGLDLLDGVLELHGNYQYISKNRPNVVPDRYDLDTARYFFKRYKVLFSAVWENKLDENNLVAYLTKRITFEDLLNSFEDINEEYIEIITKAKNIKELESIVRKFNVFNMND